MSDKDQDRRQADRVAINAQVEFFVDSGILEATGIDISETGLGFSAANPLSVALVVTIDGEETTRRARLVRVVENEDGEFVFGLEFVEPEPEPED